ncbi:MAG: dehydrogenase, partial [Planctomycetes bacterium]|nr:dehydrogenase [Planctomycetota bacterium]
MRSGVLAALSLLARILSSILAVPLLAAPAPRAPEGFSVELAAGAPAVVFPMFAAADDRGRLFVAESSGGDLYAELAALTRRCRVSLLEDRDADGRFESMRVFAEGLVFPMGLAWRDGRLYVADPPELVALEDADGDGRADRRAVVLEGFGHTDNGSLHGLVFGPDGLLYMTLGSPDGYRIRREDGSWLEGSSGALIRSRPDGSRPEVLCRGFENLVEIEFLPAGEVIGTDNWFQLPQGGVRDALVHLVEGGLYPRHEDSPRGTRYPVTGPMLPPVSLFPAVASSGIARCRGAAFPPAMRGSLFTAQHNARRVQRHVLERDGSTFRSRDEDFVTSDDPDFHPSDVLEDADGSLLVVDTGGWYVQHCPTGRIRDSRAPGGIYRVRWVAAPKVDDPWGLAVPWDRAGVEDLARLLGDGRQEVRAKAQRALAARGEAAVPALEAILAAPGRGLAGDPAKEGAVWALHAVPGDAALAALRRGLETLDADLAALCARAIGLREDRTAATALALRLFLEEEHVRLAAAEALARCGGAGQVRALLGALGGRADRFLEHALVHALFRLAGQAALEAALERPSPRVQRAALLLLEQPPRRGAPRDAVIARLASEDGPLRETAVKVLL